MVGCLPMMTRRAHVAQNTLTRLVARHRSQVMDALAAMLTAVAAHSLPTATAVVLDALSERGDATEAHLCGVLQSGDINVKTRWLDALLILRRLRLGVTRDADLCVRVQAIVGPQVWKGVSLVACPVARNGV